MEKTETATKRVLVGELTAPFGVRGEIKMRPLMENTKILARLASVQLRFAGGTVADRKIVSVRRHQDMDLVTLADVGDRDVADQFRGAGVWIREDELPALPPGEYYHHQLVGLRVVTDAGRDLGEIQRVLPYPANDVYETPLALIPGVEGEFVVGVDLAAGTMTVRDVAGLEKDS
jgi:16S rRNA processing protein RimM